MPVLQPNVTLNHNHHFICAISQYKEPHEPEAITWIRDVLQAAAKGDLKLLDAPDPWGRTALHLACEQEDIQLLISLLEHGAGVNVKDRHGFTPLHVTARKNKPDHMRILIGRGASIDERAELGVTPLYTAAQNNSTECLRLLIERGADVNALSEKHGAPLHVAARFGSIDCLDLLLQKGANPYLKSLQGHLPIEQGLRRKRAACVQLLAGLGHVNAKASDFLDTLKMRGQTLAHSLARENSDPLKVADRWVKREDLSLDSEGQSPLHYAIKQGNNGLLWFYLCLEPSMASAGSPSPLLTATLYNNSMACRWLLKYVSADEILKPGPDSLYPLLVAGLLGLSKIERIFKDRLSPLQWNEHEKLFPKGNNAQLDQGPNSLGYYFKKLHRSFPLFREEGVYNGLPPLSGDSFCVKKVINPVSLRMCGDTVTSKLARDLVNNIPEHCFPNAHQDFDGDTLAKSSALARKSCSLARKSCSLARDLIRVIYRIELGLNEHGTLGKLKPSLLCVGSLTENTRLGIQDEADVSMFFGALKKEFFAMGDDAFDFRLTRAGERFFRRAKLHAFIRRRGRRANFNVTAVFRTILKALRDVMRDLQLPERFRIGGEFECPECAGGAGSCPRYCHTAITMTKSGPCLVLLYDEGGADRPIPVAIDLIPLFPHPASPAALNAQMVRTLVEKRPPGWRASLTKYVTRDRPVEGMAVKAHVNTYVALKIQHFGEGRKFLIRSFRILDLDSFHMDALRNLYITVKGLKDVLQIEGLSSYQLKKVVLKRELIQLAQSEVSELELFYEYLSQPELRGHFERVIKLELLRIAITELERKTIYINRQE